MPRTKKDALEKAKMFKKELPDMDIIVNYNPSMGKDSALRYNFNFKRKTEKTNKIIFK